MDTLSLIFLFLTGIVLFTILSMNILPTLVSSDVEGFVDSKPSGSETSVRVRAVLDPMIGKNDLCGLYTTIRSIGVKNEKASSSQLSDSEAMKRVEKSFLTGIPGGALPCPLLKYPSNTASDLEWLDWLQKLPDDFGARVVFMAMYAREYLANQEKDIRDALSGKSAPIQEGFTSVCTPDVADSRRKQTPPPSCTLPENLNPQELQTQITNRLKTLVSTKTKVLQSKKIDPSIDIDPIVDQAVISKQYLESVKGDVENGNLPLDTSALN